MTKNQIEYQKLLETKRANIANEQITSARDEATKRLGLDTLRETARHNTQVELQARDNLNEQRRNNEAQLAEAQRTHLANEGISQQRADTESRSQSETARHNLVSEDLSQYATGVSQLAAELGASSRENAAGISAAASQYASDQALLAKQLQAQIDKYGIDVNKQTQRNQLAETRRANIARQNEINRANQASEQLKSGTLLETFRHNVISERQNLKKIDADIDLRGKANEISLMNAIANQKKVDNDISLNPSQQFSNYASGFGNVAKGVGSLAVLSGQ